MIRKIFAKDNYTLSEIEKLINSCDDYDTVAFEGVFRFESDNKRSILLGLQSVQSALFITKPNIFLDFSNSKIFFDVKSIKNKLAFFYFHTTARKVKLKGLDLTINYIGEACDSTVHGIYNNSYCLSIDDCRIEILSKVQVNAVGIYNYGGIDTHLRTKADNLSVTKCRLGVNISPSDSDLSNLELDCEAYGIYNFFANSILVSDTFIEVRNRGVGERQKSIGIFNKGRFCRFSSDNIKANGTHNEGRELKKACAVGMIDEGMYSLISNCNIVGEWGGSCIGLHVKGVFSNIVGNKILSTHTIDGITVKIEGNKTILSDNILTSTSRNARIIYSVGDIVTISGNLMEVLMDRNSCESGVGIYIENAQSAIISDNQLHNIKNCGIKTKKAKITLRDNLFNQTGDTVVEEFKKKGD